MILGENFMFKVLVVNYHDLPDPTFHRKTKQIISILQGFGLNFVLPWTLKREKKSFIWRFKFLGLWIRLQF